MCSPLRRLEARKIRSGIGHVGMNLYACLSSKTLNKLNYICSKYSLIWAFFNQFGYVRNIGFIYQYKVELMYISNI